MKLFHGSSAVVKTPQILEVHKLYDQVSFHTQKALSTLTFLESYEVFNFCF